MSSIKYSNHIAHYLADAELNDYFAPDRFEEQNIRRRYEALMALHRIKAGDRVLEIGSGGGPALRLFEKIKFTYFPLDIPVKNLQRIRMDSSERLHPVAGDVYALPFANEAFDCIILSEVLEHLEEALPALAEIRRVLKVKGTLLLSVPYKERIAYAVCVHCNRLTPFNAHFHSFDEQNLRSFLTQTQLKPFKWQTLNNKIADRLHFNLLTRALPYAFWRFFDRLFNILLPNKASHLLMSAGRNTSLLDV